MEIDPWIYLIIIVSIGVGLIYAIRRRSVVKIEENEDHYQGRQSLPYIIDVIWNDLPTGHILYNPPSKMRVGIEERIEVRIANSSIKNLNKGLKGIGYPHSEEIKVSSRMTVRLDGGMVFNIKQLFANEDMAIVGDYTQWEWDVTPLRSGIHKLKLYVDAIIEIPKLSDRTKQLAVLEREVIVKVNPKYQIRCFIGSHWQFMIKTIIALAATVAAIEDSEKPFLIETIK